MEALQKFIAFLIGLGLVVLGLLDSCPRAGTIVIGLFLMGFFSVTEALNVIRGSVSEKGNEDD